MKEVTTFQAVSLIPRLEGLAHYEKETNGRWCPIERGEESKEQKRRSPAVYVEDGRDPVVGQEPTMLGSLVHDG